MMLMAPATDLLLIFLALEVMAIAVLVLRRSTRCCSSRMGLLIVGFAFTIAAVPFHLWSPDAYESAPAVVIGFMSTGVKAAALAAFARVFHSALAPLMTDWTPVRCVMAVVTMVVGTVVAVSQTSLKRMLAYSAGDLLVAIVAANDVGKASLLFYLASYAVTNLGAFGVIALLGSRPRQRRPA